MLAVIEFCVFQHACTFLNLSFEPATEIDSSSEDN